MNAGATEFVPEASAELPTEAVPFECEPDDEVCLSHQSSRKNWFPGQAFPGQQFPGQTVEELRASEAYIEEVKAREDALDEEVYSWA